MTNEEKQLLIKDLCARLPYGVKILGKNPITKEDEVQIIDAYKLGYFEGFGLGYGIDVVKPFLRKMSSMFEEEINEAEKIRRVEYISGEFAGLRQFTIVNGDFVDWLNSHHFDYRGLIEKGLALEAPEGMYKTK